MDKSRYFFILLGLLLGIYIFNAIRKGKLTVDLSLMWILGAIGIFILGCFPNIIIFFANIIGIAYAPSLLFLLGIAFLLLLVLSNTLTISDLKEKNKELTQALAILEERFRKQENSSKEDKN